MNDMDILKYNVVLVVMYDKVAQTYSTPLAFNSVAESVRWFLRYVVNQNIGEPTDYELYLAGFYDEKLGVIKPLDKIEFITKGKVTISVKKQQRKKIIPKHNFEQLQLEVKEDEQLEVKEDEKEEI